MARTAGKRIEIDEDRTHQRVEWRIERVGWALMALLVLAAALGLLGDGPLGEARASRGEGLDVEFDRLQRAAAPTEYRFSVDPVLAGGGTLRLRLDASLLDEIELQSIVPEPVSVAAGPGYTEFEFAIDGTGGAPARIAFRFQPTTFGPVQGKASVPGARPLALDHFVYP